VIFLLQLLIQTGDLFFLRRCCAQQVPDAQQRFQPGQQLKGVERLDNIVIRPFLQPLYLHLYLSPCREEYKRNGLQSGPRLNDPEKPVSIHLRHHDITQDDVGRVLLQPFQCRFSVVSRHKIIVLLNNPRDILKHIGVVINDENEGLPAAEAVGYGRGLPGNIGKFDLGLQR